MTIKSVIEKRFNEVMRKSKEMSFPVLLRGLRDAYGVTRRLVADEADIPYATLTFWEDGFFRTELSRKKVDKLAEFYMVDSKFLLDKADEYVEHKTGFKTRS
jgi:transcriptional regulator with XRE-family HTH domain